MKITKVSDYSIIEDIFNYKINASNPFLKVIVIEKMNTIYGFVAFNVIYDRIEIDMIIVVDKYKRNKVGTKLMEYIDNYSLQNKIKNITLEVRETNIPAIALYKKFGYKEISIRKDYYKTENGILMLKEVK